MTGTQLRYVKQETDWQGNDRFELTFIRGRSEATVTVTVVGGEITPECEELPGDSFMDELALEEAASEFVNNHGHGFGDIDQL